MFTQPKQPKQPPTPTAEQLQRRADHTTKLSRERGVIPVGVRPASPRSVEHYALLQNLYREAMYHYRSDILSLLCGPRCHVDDDLRQLTKEELFFQMNEINDQIYLLDKANTIFQEMEAVLAHRVAIEKALTEDGLSADIRTVFRAYDELFMSYINAVYTKEGTAPYNAVIQPSEAYENYCKALIDQKLYKLLPTSLIQAPAFSTIFRQYKLEEYEEFAKAKSEATGERSKTIPTESLKISPVIQEALRQKLLHSLSEEIGKRDEEKKEKIKKDLNPQRSAFHAVPSDLTITAYYADDADERRTALTVVEDRIIAHAATLETNYDAFLQHAASKLYKQADEIVRRIRTIHDVSSLIKYRQELTEKRELLAKQYIDLDAKKRDQDALDFIDQTREERCNDYKALFLEAFKKTENRRFLPWPLVNPKAEQDLNYKVTYEEMLDRDQEAANEFLEITVIPAMADALCDPDGISSVPLDKLRNAVDGTRLIDEAMMVLKAVSRRRSLESVAHRRKSDDVTKYEQEALALIRVLYDHGADPSSKNRSGQNARELAQFPDYEHGEPAFFWVDRLYELQQLKSKLNPYYSLRVEITDILIEYCRKRIEQLKSSFGLLGKDKSIAKISRHKTVALLCEAVITANKENNDDALLQLLEWVKEGKNPSDPTTAWEKGVKSTLQRRLVKALNKVKSNDLVALLVKSPRVEAHRLEQEDRKRRHDAELEKEVKQKAEEEIERRMAEQQSELARIRAERDAIKAENERLKKEAASRAGTGSPAPGF